MRHGRIIAFSIGLILLPALCAPAIAGGAEPTKSLDEIQAALAHDGDWIDDFRWGTVWSPQDVFFRPYSLGHWTVDGRQWTYHGANAWDELTAHYGHWIDDDFYGWVWKPDGTWRPAAVEFRIGAGHVGWAPLDPVGNAPKNPADWVFVKGVDAVAENLGVVKLPPLASVELFDKTHSLTAPPTEMAVLGLPDPGQPPLAEERVASSGRTTM